jgi:hypothetical protein
MSVVSTPDRRSTETTRKPPQYDRRSVRASRHRRYLPRCACDAPVEVVAYRIVNGDIQYRLRCCACGEMRGLSIAHAKIRPQTKAAAVVVRQTETGEYVEVNDDAEATA